METVQAGDKEEDFGLIRPSLIKSLKSILDQYPDDGQILKELLQNAEDAGATKVQFLYDGHSYGKKKLHHKDMAAFQGPALYAYNNALFNEEDWKGIRMLQDSVKEKDPMKVGRFGLGFKSVLHMTDLPSVLSRDRIFIIDPHEKFFMFEGNKTTGYRWHLHQKQREMAKIPDQFEPYKGKFGCSNETFKVGNFDGTMFRFPLRTKESPLSDTVYDGARMKSLYDSFEADAHLLLLFLKNIQSVELMTREGDQDKPVINFKVSIAESCQEFVQQKRREFSESVKSYNAFAGPSTVTYPLVIETVSYENGNVLEKKSYKWLVNEYFAGNEVSGELKKLVNDTALSYKPLVGTAMPLQVEKLETAATQNDLEDENENDEEQNQNDKPSGQVFCFLPLPVEQKSPTGLPVHVNGYFSVSQNRRHLKWPTTGQHYQSDKSLKWNHCLLEEIVPRSYVELINQAVQYAKKYKNLVTAADVYHAMPNLMTVDEKWQVILEPLCTELLTQEVFYTIANGGNWLGLDECLVDCLKEDPETKEVVINILIEAGVPVIQIPMHVLIAIGAYSDVSLEEVSPAILRSKLQSSNLLYCDVSAKHKMLLLNYILKDEDFKQLQGIELLPVLSGNFVEFNRYASAVFISTPDCPAELLAGLESQILSADLPEAMQRKFNNLARQKLMQLEILDSNKVVSLLHEIIPKEWSSQDVVDFDETSSLPYSWLEQLWKFLRTHFPSDLSVVTGHPVLPLDNKVITRLVPITMPSSVVCKSAMGTELPESVCEVLMKIGVYVVEELPEFVSTHAAVIGNYVHLPLPQDVVQSMAIVHQRMGSSYFQFLRKDITTDQRMALMSFLAKISQGELSSDLVRFLKSLPLFEITGTSSDNSKNIVSVSEVGKAAPEYNLPVQLEEPYLLLTSEDQVQVAKLLGAIFITKSSMFSETILPKIKSRSYDNEEIQKIMIHVLENIASFTQEDPNFLEKLSDVPFVVTESGEFERPNCLFDPEVTVLKDMFAGQNLFPAACYIGKENLMLLRKMGLKSVFEITAKDVLYSAFHLDKMISKYESEAGASVDQECIEEDSDYEIMDKKGLALLKFLCKKPEHLSVHTNGKKLSEWLKDVCWMPILQKKPELFPESLEWKSSSCRAPVGKPKDMIPYDWALLVGSQCKVARKLISDDLGDALNWTQVPDVELVVLQLEALVEKYQPQEKAKYMALLAGIYDHLAKINHQEVLEVLQRNDVEAWVWQGDGFTSIDKVFFKRLFADLRPYIFSIPSELQPFHDMFALCGMKEHCPGVTLVQIINEIAEKYAIEEVNENHAEDTSRDLLLVVDILNHLKTILHELNEDLLEQLLMPAQSTSQKTLRLLPLSELTYCDTEWLRQGFDLMTFDEQDGITFIHDNVPVPTATLLKVPTLMSRMLHAEELDITGFGQSEPLTDRLKRLLEDYTDGLAIPKELIQNADDAHATKVKFLFDERTNSDHMKFLIDEGMKGCQGPALWVYNNAVFTDEDFDNIVRLGGATKEKEIDKIGKFGLGFNAVYNITDVPSFISRNSIVIFDPHTTHLGRGIHDRSKPGIKIDVHKNKTLLRKLPDQFHPYDGVFGCETGGDATKFYDGTLFRLPFRSRQQAACSQICNISYDSSEVTKLLQMTIKNAHNLLLFTQNVIEVEFYHLADGAEPKDAVLMFSVYKEPVKIIRELAYMPPKLPDNANLNTEQSQLIANSNFLTAVSKYLKIESKSKNSRMMSIPQIPQSTMVIKTASELTSDGEKVLGFKRDPQKEYWLLSACMGQEKSLAFAKSQGNNEFVPIAGVALALRKEGECFMPQTYNRGLAFCYLPLPMPVGIPVHVNGTFAIQSSRRCLFEQTADDKHNVKYQWNQILIEDAIVHAYLQLLGDLNQILPPDIDVPLFQVWPSAHSIEGYFKPLIASFYKGIATLPNMPIAFHNGSAIPFSDAAFLDAAFTKAIQLKASGGNKGGHSIENPAKAAAISVFTQAVKDQVIVIVPESLLHGFRQAGYTDLVKQKTYDVFRFFSQIFFPNIASIDANTRDILIVFALHRGDEALDDLMNQYHCIAVSPDGKTLRKPSEVVCPSAVAALMFDPEDGRFPYGVMAEGHNLQALKRLGMIVNELDWNDLLDRAKSVISLYDIKVDMGRIRLSRLLAAIDRKLTSTEYSQKRRQHGQVSGSNENPVELKKQQMAHHFRTLPFLPTKKKPKYFPVQWLGSTEDDEQEWCPSLMSAQDMFPFDQRHLVSATQPIVDEESMPIRVKRFLELTDIQPKPEHVITQAEHAMQVDMMTVNKDSYGELQRVFYNIYKYLQDACKEDVNMVDIVANAFKEREFLLVGNYLVSPDKVSFQYDNRAAPFLFGMPDDMKRNFPELMTILGVRQSFEVRDYIEATKTLYAQYGQRKMDEKHIQVCLALSSQLNESMKNNNLTFAQVEEKYGTIYLPSAVGVLQPASALCYNDCPWVANKDTMSFTHPGITLQSSDNLGVKTKRQEVLRKHAKGFPFGQKENLVNSLNRLLTNYPLDHEVLKELIQNADDAGASEIHFILDPRKHEDKLVFEDSWKPLQGPALLVYNNKPFGQHDLEAIQRLGEGSKIHDPTKTGQYGVGFSSVYHLTDVPCILTDVPDCGNSLCVFDPQCTYVPDATSAEPGMRYTDLENLKEQFPDVFRCFLEDKIDTKNATLFRFPLRNHKMAGKSKLSSHVVQTGDIRRLFVQLQNETFDILLFTNNVTQIKISEVSYATGELTLLYGARSGMTKEDMEIKKEMTMGVHKAKEVIQRPDFSLHDIEPQDVVYTQFLRDTLDNEEKWSVAQRLGVSPEAVVPDPVEIAIKNGSMVVLPRGGVAYMIETRSKNTLVAKPRKRKVFCFLPLPVVTELIVHINGHFALGYENRRQLATEAEGEHKLLWNSFLLKHVIARAYVKLLEGLRTSAIGHHIQKKVDDNVTIVQSPRILLDMHLKTYQNAFPDFVEKEPQWTCLVESVYRTVAETNACVLPCLKELPAITVAQGANNDVEQKPQWQVLWLPPAGKGFQKAFFTSKEYEEEQHKEVKSPSESILKTGIKGLKSIGGWLRGSSAATKDEKETPPQKTDSQILKEVLQDCGFKILEATPKVVENFKKADVAIDFMSPEGVIEFFKTYSTEQPACQIVNLPAELKETPFFNVETLKIVLKYCQKIPMEDLLQCLDGLPLLLTNDGVLRVFDGDDPVFLSKDCDLIPECGQMFLHKEMCEQVFKDVKPEDDEIFQRFGINELAAILDRHIPPEDYHSQDGMIVWNKPDSVISDRWMLQLWTFVASCLEEVLKNKEICADEKGTFVRQQIASLEEWSLVPAYRETKNLLLSIANAFKVISFHPQVDEKYKNVQAIVEKLNLPALELRSVSSFHAKDVLNLDLLSHIVTTLERPAAVLEVLYHMVKEQLLTVRLTPKERSELLKYFNDNIEVLSNDGDENKDKLMALPFYTTIYKDVISLEGCLVYTLPAKIPTAGVEVWQSKSGTVFLEREEELQSLYDYIDCKSITAEEVYCMFIFQHFEYFEPKERMEHLYHVYKTYIIDGSTGFKNEEEKQQFMGTLKELPFIEDEDGDLQPPSAFYDPENVVFGVMMEEDEFPPKPTLLFKESEWYIFLRKLGLIQEVTEERYLQYTNSVAREGKDPNNASAEAKSKVLCEHLFQMQAGDRDDIMKQISNVAFIAPAKVPTALVKLHPQHGDLGNALLPYIPFEDSVSKRYENVSWTSANILPNWADPSDKDYIHGDEKETIMQNLGIQKEPTPEVVISHIKNLCENHVPDRQFIPEIRKAVFRSIYEYLSEHNKDGNAKQMFEVLKKLPCIIVEGGKQHVCPEQTVFNIYKEIKPFLYKVPIELGEFQELFRSLGATDRATTKQYAMVLQNLKSKVQQSHLSPNEMVVAIKATKGYFQALEEIGSGGQYNLYLPSEKRQLVESYRLVFNDAPAFYERVHGYKVRFMVDLRHCGLKNKQSEDTVFRMPPDSRPVILSSLVVEKLHEKAEMSICTEGIAAELEKRIQSDEFNGAVARLIRHGFHKAGQKLDEDEMYDIIGRLSTLHIYGVNKVQTHLMYQGEIVKASDLTKSCFVTSTDGPIKKWSIFINKDAKLDQELLIPLAEVINSILSGMLKDSVLYLLPVLSCTERDIHKKLNALNIKIDHSQVTNEVAVLPELGKDVTNEDKNLLEENNDEFASDEFVAFKREVDGAVIYAKILDEVEGPPEKKTKTYMLNCGNGQDGVLADSGGIYKFVRK